MPQAPYGQLFNPFPGGSTFTQTGPGKNPSKGSGVKKVAGPGPSSAAVAAAVMPPPGSPKPGQQGPRGQPPQPHPARRPQFSANNPMMSTQPPPVPHPGLMPPYPDARSKAATLMPDGTPVLPTPHGFGGNPPSMPRVPTTFAPQAVPQFPGPSHGMTGLLRHR